MEIPSECGKIPSASIHFSISVKNLFRILATSSVRSEYEGMGLSMQIVMAMPKAANKQFPSGGHFTTWT